MSVVADIQTALKTNSKKTKIQLMDEGYQPFKGNPPYEKRIFFVYGDVMIIVVPEAKPLTATLLIFKHSTDSGGIWYFREKEKNNNK